MRKKRVIQAGKCYHLVSRVAHRAYFLDDEVKAQFGGSGAGSGFGELLASYARRMFHPSEFMKTLKQDMTMSFNARREHSGTIWEGRFYDRRSNPTVKDMSAQAAYVDCNPAEAGVCRNPVAYKWCSWAAAMSGDEHARDMYRFIYKGAANDWDDIVELHKAAIRARLGGIDNAVKSGGIVDWLFGMFGSGKGKKAEREKKMQRPPSVLAEKCPTPHKRELALEEGDSETATRLLALLAPRARSRSELGTELGVSSQSWLLRAYLNPLMAQGYIAQTLPNKPKSPLQRYRLLRKGKAVLS